MARPLLRVSGCLRGTVALWSHRRAARMAGQPDSMHSRRGLGQLRLSLVAQLIIGMNLGLPAPSGP
jgi:hypothetical protein